MQNQPPHQSGLLDKVIPILALNANQTASAGDQKNDSAGKDDGGCK